MRARKIDANQNKIVKELRARGFSVGITSSLGNGFPDLVVAKGKTVLVELKDGGKTKSRQKLTPDEELFISRWKGELIVANCIEDILNTYETKQKACE